MTFDWHGAEISRDTPIGADFRTTQNVRRFLRAQAGLPAEAVVKIDRDFRKWIETARPKTMGEFADEWLRRHGQQ